ncbi:MAG: hypothetical protein CL445_01550 [Acidimicrobiaceae bacterium]|nr:hypothetical protein [Acidimicrobiaceae bacterium]
MGNLSACDAWLATQNQDGSPHLVPIWFVATQADSIWIATGRHDTEVKNISKTAKSQSGCEPRVTGMEMRLRLATPHFTTRLQPMCSRCLIRSISSTRGPVQTQMLAS